MKTFKIILITLIPTLIFCIVFFIYLDNKHKTELALNYNNGYLYGKNESIMFESYDLIKNLEISLNEFKKDIDNYSEIIKEIQEVNNNVIEKMEDLKNNIISMDTDINKLHSVWSRNK